MSDFDLSRFTDRARRALMLAYSMAQMEGEEPAVRPPPRLAPPPALTYVLLGLLREGCGIAANVLRDLGLTEEKILALGFMSPCPTICAEALDLAWMLGHTHVGTEHLLLAATAHMPGQDILAGEARAKTLGYLGTIAYSAIKTPDTYLLRAGETSGTTLFIGDRQTGKTERLLAWLAGSTKEAPRVGAGITVEDVERLRNRFLAAYPDRTDVQFMPYRDLDSLRGMEFMPALGVDRLDALLPLLFGANVGFATMTNYTDGGVSYTEGAANADHRQGGEGPADTPISVPGPPCG